jgi:transcriptional regulator with XRE-family HTH domain
MTPEETLKRLRAECRGGDNYGRASELARLTGRSPTLISRVAKGKRRLTEDLQQRLMRAWAMEDGRPVVVQMQGKGPAPPPTGELAEALRLRTGDWSSETQRALRAVEVTATAHGLTCPVGAWIAMGDQLERSKSERHG